MVFYLDNDVAIALAPTFAAAGHRAVTARDLGLQTAPDAQHLLEASRRAEVLVTHNQRDFLLLHDAWQLWAGAWGGGQTHAGILVLPQRPVDELATLVNECLQRHPVLVGHLARRVGGVWMLA